MRARIAVLAFVVLCGHSAAEPAKYAVDGLVLGTQLNFESASYGEYRCRPSEQFDELTWCQKTRRGRSDIAIYSLLHSRDGNVLYINRSQEPAFLNAKKAEQNIQQSSSNIGELPRVIRMPHRSGFPDGLIAVWGKVTLEQLDQESIKVLVADRKALKKGLLIDFLGNFVRSAKVGLPVYRMDGGPGFVWAASFDQKGHGILRLGAVDASKFLPPLAGQQPTAQMTEATSEASEAKPELRQANEKVQPELPLDATTIVDPEKAKPAAEWAQTEDASAKSNGEVQPKLPDDTATIVDPEKTKPAAESAQTEDASARSNGEVQPELTDATATIVEPEEAKAAAEPVRTKDTSVSERVNLDAVGAPSEAKSAIGNANATWWEILVWGSIVGLLATLTACAVVIYRKRQKASVSKEQVLLHRTDLIEAGAEPAIGKALSPEAALDKIEAIRRSLLLHLTSSPSLARSSAISSKGPMPTEEAFDGAEPRSLEKLVELV
jgi:hypothetical protein